jgi:hypothetical protein
MKTTLEIPDDVFRRAKSAAAERGIPLRELVTEAVKDKLVARSRTNDKPWMAGFGKLRGRRKENARINRIIEKEFERIDAEDRL